MKDREKAGRKPLDTFTPSEILFEIQLQKRGFIEIDIAIRTPDPFKYERHIIGEPTRIRGLEPGEIMKLRRDIQAYLVWWRGDLARERNDRAIEQRMTINVPPKRGRPHGKSNANDDIIRSKSTPSRSRDDEGGVRSYGSREVSLDIPPDKPSHGHSTPVGEADEGIPHDR